MVGRINFKTVANAAGQLHVGHENMNNNKPKKRKDTVLTSNDDHNPLILQDCSNCRGSGKVSEKRGEIHFLKICLSCNGSGTTGKIEKYFLTDPPPMNAILDLDGWLQCPGCGKRFAIRDTHRWSGKRHITCGQRIEINKS